MLFKKPSNYREWSPDQELLPIVEFLDSNRVRIQHVRNISYRTQDDYDLRYYDATYDLDAIDSVWFLLAPFNLPGVAHTLLSFRFADGRALTLSVEIRKKKGEQFSLWRVFPQKYELMYVLADERDVVRLRLSIWKDSTYFFPLRIDAKAISTILRSALERANRMRERPEFYHVTLNNCTNNLIGHLKAGGVTLPRVHWRYVLPASIASLFEAYELLPRGETAATVHEKYCISPLMETCGDDEGFSRCIRRESSFQGDRRELNPN